MMTASTAFICGPAHFHPYECDSSSCPHCQSERTDEHDPDVCRLCHWQDDDEERCELRAMLAEARAEIRELKETR